VHHQKQRTIFEAPDKEGSGGTKAVQGRYRRYKEGTGGTIASNQNVSLKNTYYIMKIKKEISIV